MRRRVWIPLAALVAWLEAGRVFDQVLLVSHESDLRDAFDQTIQVERGPDGWSSIGGEEVAA